MIARLRGILDGIGDNHCIVDVGGVGYLVFCSGRTLAAMPGAGESVQLHIETHVREDHIHLFGFADSVERDWFNLLTGVQGVGARVALGILGILAPGELAQAIVAQDKTLLTRAPNVGPKLAGRICGELKEKAGRLAIGPGVAVGAGAEAVAATAAAGRQAGDAGANAGDAISALVNLGYGRSEAFGAVHEAIAALGNEADLQLLIRNSLQALAR